MTIDKIAVARNFSRAAITYDEVAVLQQEVGNRLLERLDFFKVTPKRILDCGSGTGFFNHTLKNKFPNAKIISLDIAEGMLNFANQNNSINNFSICADAENLPIRNHCIDLVFSNCTFQWCSNLIALFNELKRVLTTNGIILFSTFGPDTLKELRGCRQQLNPEVSLPFYADMHNIGDLLLQNHFQDPVMEMEMMTLLYHNTKALRQDLKRMGAHEIPLMRESNPLSYTNRRSIPKHTHRQQIESSLTRNGKIELQNLNAGYEMFRNDASLLPATFEVIFGKASLKHSLKIDKNLQKNLLPTKIVE